MADQINSLEDLQAVVGDAATDAAVVEEAISLAEPQRDELGRSYATGKRKDAVAVTAPISKLPSSRMVAAGEQ